MPPVYPLTVFTPDELGHYPHMAKRDAEVWIPWIRTHGADYVGFSYDVALGGVILPEEMGDEKMRRAWQYNTALKIDAVGWQGNQAWVIEVRPDATTSALGAALSYTLVAKREKLTELPIIPAIVCRAIQPDVRWACAVLGIVVFQV